MSSENNLEVCRFYGVCKERKCDGKANISFKRRTRGSKTLVRDYSPCKGYQPNR